jgi:large subunit ribosomal protein L4
LWVGGGVTHGPTKDKNYALKINKQARRGALASLLSRKFKDEEIFFIDSLSSVDSKTKTAVAMLKKFASATEATKLSLRGGRTLILLGKSDSAIIRAFRNLPYVEVEEARNINVEKAITPKYLIFTKDAIGTFGA